MKKRNHRKVRLNPQDYLDKNQIQQIKDYLSQQVGLAKIRGSRRMIVTAMIIDTLLNTGLRASELCDLQIQDLPLHHEKLIVYVRCGKGCKPRTVDVSKAFANRLENFIRTYRKYAKPNSYLFINERYGPFDRFSLYLRIQKLGQKVGIPLRPHRFRHTYGTQLYSIAKDLLAVQSQLGHSDINTVTIYARTMNDDLRRQVEQLDL